MRPSYRKAVAATGVAALAVTLAACGGGGGSGDSGSAKKGGTLVLRNFGEFEHLDPQRTYVGADISFIGRTMARTLTSFPAKSGAASNKLIPDAATDTGKATNDNKTWTFTIRKGLKWQDGKPVTCEQFKYGPSRTFATSQITSGPNYQVQWLDIPTEKNGESKYKGPYVKDKAGQALYDKAVTCDGNKITYRLNSPHGDFNQTVYMPAFAAIRKDKDTGTKYDFTPFSDGPYKVQGGKMDKKKGGTLVRNKYWDSKSDGGLRKAYPDKIKVEIGDTAETIAEAMIADSGAAKNTVSYTRVPPSHLADVVNNKRAKERYTTVDAPYTDYIWFNLTKMKNPKIREALATGFNKTAYATASGGKALMKPADGGTINPTLATAFEKSNPFGVGPQGDPAKAKAILKKAGVKMPVPLTYVYRGSATQDKVSSSVQAELGKAGFKIKLKKVPESTDYYSKVQDPSFDADVDFGWGSWGADWPSGSTVVPALFTGQQVEKDSRGQNYGAFKDPAYDKKVQANYLTKDPKAAEKKWAQLDQEVVKRTAILPVGYNVFPYLHGSNVKNYTVNDAEGSCVDLANVAVSGS